MDALTLQSQNPGYPLYHRWQGALRQLVEILATHPTLSQLEKAIHRINECVTNENPYPLSLAKDLLNDPGAQAEFIQVLELKIYEYEGIFSVAWHQQSSESSSLLLKTFTRDMKHTGAPSLYTQSLLLLNPRSVGKIEMELKLPFTSDLYQMLENYRKNFYTPQFLAYHYDISYGTVMAAYYGHMDVLKAALRHHMKSDMNAELAMGAAVGRCHQMEVVELLLNDKNADMCLYVAVEKGQMEVAVLALDRGVPPKRLDKALLIATEKGNLGMVEFLIHRGAKNISGAAKKALEMVETTSIPCLGFPARAAPKPHRGAGNAEYVGRKALGMVGGNPGASPVPRHEHVLAYLCSLLETDVETLRLEMSKILISRF